MVVFEKIGADPEWRLVSPSAEPISAPRLLFSGASAGTSFIGLDGNGTTGELRPPPNADVRRLLAHIARGVVVVDHALGKWTPKPQMHAAPMTGGAPLGGHIHVSFTSSRAERAVVQHRAVWESLTYLQGPLETWVQPTRLHTLRRNAYGGAYDIRGNDIGQPRSQWRQRWWYEYRTPSTWLAHPAIAYLYLALAKLTVLNLVAAYELAHGARPLFEPEAGAPKSHRALVQRLSTTGSWRRTKDLLLVPEALAVADVLVERGYGPEVNVEAWRELDVCPKDEPQDAPNEDTEADAALGIPTGPWPLYDFLDVVPASTGTTTTTARPPLGYDPVCGCVSCQEQRERGLHAIDDSIDGDDPDTDEPDDEPNDEPREEEEDRPDGDNDIFE